LEAERLRDGGQVPDRAGKHRLRKFEASSNLTEDALARKLSAPEAFFLNGLESVCARPPSNWLPAIASQPD
jgi:hypothetical protein